MSSTQTKLLKEFEVIANSNGLDFTVNKNYANTGTILIQRGFTTLLQISFDFQSSYCGLTFKGDAIAALSDERLDAGQFFISTKTTRAHTSKPDEVTYHHLCYAESERMQAALAFYENLIEDLALTDGDERITYRISADYIERLRDAGVAPVLLDEITAQTSLVTGVEQTINA